jgi:adenylyltransferase/sulfurtransferase
LKVRKNPDCPVCGDHPTVTELIDYEQFCGIPGQPLHVSADEGVPEVSVWDLKARRENGSKPFLLDVRKPFENDIATMHADQLIPHDQLAERLGELKAGPNDEIVVHCRSGVRSAIAVEILKDAGYKRAFNLAGGILAWSREIDPSVPQY